MGIEEKEMLKETSEIREFNKLLVEIRSLQCFEHYLINKEPDEYSLELVAELLEWKLLQKDKELKRLAEIHKELEDLIDA